MTLQSDNGLQSLQQFLRLKPSESRGLDDVVFVAIDLKYLLNLKLSYQRMISSLDHLIVPLPRQNIFSVKRVRYISEISFSIWSLWFRELGTSFLSIMSLEMI